ncbi:hypothetical protein ACO2Q7_11345 [Rathayibacter sp. KR2-224]|uniref:hypothetical protein n=1 Tax=Rathayibacter sp. KR2-224 TaxID=3400913 RepID=UPI003C0C0E61
MPAGKRHRDVHGSPPSGSRHRTERSGALWRRRTRAQAGLLAAMAGTIAIVAALVGVIAGIAAQAPATSVRATIDAGPSSAISRSVSWQWDAGDEHPSQAVVRAALGKQFAGLPVRIEQDASPEHSARWTVTPDDSRIRPEQLTSVRHAESRLVEVVRGLPGLSDTPVKATGGGIDALRSMEQANAALSAVLPVPASVLAVAGVIALALLAQLLVDARDNETRLLRARGASVRAIVLADVTETAVTAILGCVGGGIAAGLTLALTVGMPAPGSFLLPCAGVLLGSVAVVVGFAAVAAERASGEARQVSGRVRLGISAGSTLVLLAIAGISMWRFVQGQASTGPVDPIAVVAPAAVLCALATFAVIFFGPVSAAIETGVSRSPGVASLPMRLVSRHAAVFAAPVALLTLAVAVATFASGYQATWSSFLTSSSRLVVGGDARVDLDAPQFVAGPSDASPLKRIVNVPGVSVAVPAMTIPADIGPLSVDLVGVKANMLPTLNSAPGAMFDAAAIGNDLTRWSECIGPSGECEISEEGAQRANAVRAAGQGIGVAAGAKELTLSVQASASAATTAHITAWLTAPTGEAVPVSADDVPVQAVKASDRVSAQQVRIPLPDGVWAVAAIDVSVDLPQGSGPSQGLAVNDMSALAHVGFSISKAEADGHQLSLPQAGWQLQSDVYDNGDVVTMRGHANDLGFDGAVGATTAPTVRVRLAPKVDSNVVPVALSSAAAAQTGLKVGATTTIDLPQGSLPLRVVAVTPQIPGTSQAAAALVDLPTLTTAMLHASQDLPAVDTVFVEAHHGAPATGGRFDARALSSAMPSASVVTPDVALPTRFIAPVVLALELGAYGCCALAIVALAASLAALWRGRRGETVILRAIGFAPQTQARSRAAEAGLAVSYAVVCGVLAGILVTIVAGNALARRSVPGAPQGLPVVGTFDLVWLIGCLSALLLVLALVVVRYATTLYRSAVHAVPGRTTT